MVRLTFTIVGLALPEVIVGVVRLYVSCGHCCYRSWMPKYRVSVAVWAGDQGRDQLSERFRSVNVLGAVVREFVVDQHTNRVRVDETGKEDLAYQIVVGGVVEADSTGEAEAAMREALAEFLGGGDPTVEIIDGSATAVGV